MPPAAALSLGLCPHPHDDIPSGTGAGEKGFAHMCNCTLTEPVDLS